MKHIDLRVSTLLQRSTAIFIVMGLLLGYAGVSFCILVHLYLGLKEILADYIHHEVTRHIVEMLIGLLILIACKYAFMGL